MQSYFNRELRPPAVPHHFKANTAPAPSILTATSYQIIRHDIYTVELSLLLKYENVFLNYNGHRFALELTVRGRYLLLSAQKWRIPCSR